MNNSDKIAPNTPLIQQSKMDNQSIFDVLNLNINFFGSSPHTYYTCEVKSNTWVCQKGFLGQHVFKVPVGRDPQPYLKKALEFEVIVK